MKICLLIKIQLVLTNMAIINIIIIIIIINNNNNNNNNNKSSLIPYKIRLKSLGP
jgi:hypothetical protein